MTELTDELRALVRAGFHNVLCHEYEVIHEGDKKGRARKVGLPAYGSDRCLCHTLELKYNGEVI